MASGEAPTIVALKEISEIMQEELSWIEDDAVRSLVKEAMLRGAPDFKSGFEDNDGKPIEAAWPDSGIGIAAAGFSHSSDLEVREAAEWGIEELLAKFEEDR